jgi:hypothetical protein
MRAACQADWDSSRIATIGDSRVARHAGNEEAAVVTAATITADVAEGSQPISCRSKKRSRSETAPMMTSAAEITPATAIFSPPPMTSDSTSRLTAPSAMRVPISTVR